MQNTATPGNNCFEELKKIKFVLHSVKKTRFNPLESSQGLQMNALI
jgi:hypothetical protein